MNVGAGAIPQMSTGTFTYMARRHSTAVQTLSGGRVVNADASESTRVLTDGT